jgi:predicted alpha/beta hydrolase family esterase
MKAVRIHGYGNATVLKYEDAADVESERHISSHIRGFAPIPRPPFPFHSIVVASTNDPHITIERARGLANV